MINIIGISLQDLKDKTSYKEDLELFQEWFGDTAIIHWSPMHELLCRKALLCINAGNGSHIKGFLHWLRDEQLLPSFSFLQMDLQNSDLYDADLSDLDFSYSNFSNADLGFVCLCNSNCERVNFTKADLTSVNAYSSNCRDAVFTNAILDYANFSYADLKYADFRDTNLINTQNLHTATLKGAMYNSNTKFPDGLDPIQYKMIEM